MSGLTTIEQLEGEAGEARALKTVDDVLDRVLWEPAKREIYIRALQHVEAGSEPCRRMELEELMLALPEAASMHQAPGVLVDALVACGALDEQLPEPVFDEDTQEYFTDRAQAAYTLTEIGAEALEDLSASARTRSVIDEEPQFKDSYVSLLSFCAAKARSRTEIDELLDEVCAAQPNPASVTGYGLYASYFTDKLQASGALAWRDGWTTTEEGKALLEVFQ